MNFEPFTEQTAFGPMIKHPFYIGLYIDDDARKHMHMPSVEEIVRAKWAMVQEYIEQKKWSSVIWTYERPWRTEALVDLWDDYRLSQGLVGKLAVQVWMDCENIHQCLDHWKRLFREIPAECWMSENDLEVLEDLPDELTVYRGVCNDGGISWTLDERTAKFFANRGVNGSTGEVVSKTVPKSHVWAFFGGRGESEIILLTEDWT